MILLPSENPHRPRRVQSVRLAHESGPTASKLLHGSIRIQPVLNGGLLLPPSSTLSTFSTPIASSPSTTFRPSKRDQRPRPRRALLSAKLRPFLPLPKAIDGLTVAMKMLVDRPDSAAALSREPPHDHTTRSDHKKKRWSATE
jgi:hypothetical protein